MQKHEYMCEFCGDEFLEGTNYLPVRIKHGERYLCIGCAEAIEIVLQADNERAFNKALYNEAWPEASAYRDGHAGEWSVNDKLTEEERTLATMKRSIRRRKEDQKHPSFRPLPTFCEEPVRPTQIKLDD